MIVLLTGEIYGLIIYGSVICLHLRNCKNFIIIKEKNTSAAVQFFFFFSSLKNYYKKNPNYQNNGFYILHTRFIMSYKPRNIILINIQTTQNFRLHDFRMKENKLQMFVS